MDIRTSSIPVPPQLVAGDRSTVPATAALASATAKAVQQPTPAPTLGQVAQAVDDINRSVQKLSSGLEFSVDRDHQDKVIVKVVDQATREVIRQMPTEEALEIAKALDRSQGLLIRQKG